MKNPIPTLVTALALLAAGCATTGTHTPSQGDPVRVSLHLYRAGQVLELATRAHTDPVQAYSTTRTQSNLKVVEDETMLDLVEYLELHGFAEFEEPGPAPRGVGPYILAFEIESPAGVSHWGTSQASPREAQKKIQECYRHFINDVYNQVRAFQAFENPEGIFEQPELPEL